MPEQPETQPGGTGPEEPDYRFTLANERTFLAWLRTALALLAAGVAVPALVDPAQPTWARSGLSLLCLVMSVVAAVGGVLRWRAVDAAVRRSAALPLLRLPWLLTAAFVALAAGGVVLLVGRS